MISLIEALRYRCLKDVRRPLGPFHVLVGPNASGKTTFLGVVSLLGRLVADGLEAAVTEESAVFSDLTWGRCGGSFELAVEASIPEELRVRLRTTAAETIRYEVEIGSDPNTGESSILAEKVLLLPHRDSIHQTRLDFPREGTVPRETLLTAKASGGVRAVVNKVRGGNDNFYSEVTNGAGKGWAPAFKLGPRKSALGNLPEDESKFPASTWLKRLLIEGVQPFVLNSLLIRKASPPGQTRRFKPDGSNLPWIVADLEKRHEERLRDWVSHIRTALPDLEAIRTIEREDDKHRYLVLRYGGGLEIPSWLASDGTLRLLALTLPAYLPDLSGVFLIEEPENGIHPRAVESVFQSLSSVYGAQVLVATHSPVILGLVKPRDVLCFARTLEGATDIVNGADHPALRDWRGETDLGTLFASGILG